MGLKRIWLVSRENVESIAIVATRSGLFHRAEIESHGGAPPDTPCRTCQLVEWQNGREVAVVLHQRNLLETYPTYRVPQGCLTKGSLLRYHLSRGSEDQEPKE